MTEYDKERKQWQFISDENDIETIFKKLDWICIQTNAPNYHTG